MAGPSVLAPYDVHYEIPTWAFGRETVVNVDAEAAGSIEMTAGGSPTETTTVGVGHTSFTRNFGGVLLAIKNLTSGNITVNTG